MASELANGSAPAENAPTAADAGENATASVAQSAGLGDSTPTGDRLSTGELTVPGVNAPLGELIPPGRGTAIGESIPAADGVAAGVTVAIGDPVSAEDIAPAGETAAAIAQAQAISADEIALYDRQIRLWGVKAQEQIRNASILVITAKALANEIAKNLVLAGIGSLSFIDHEAVTEDDLGAQFLISEADIGSNRAQAAAVQLRKLNPRVKVDALIDDIRTQDQTLYSQFDIVIATDLDYAAFSAISAATHFSLRPLYVAGVHGFYGYIFVDLIQHDYVIEREKSNLPTVPGTVESASRSVVGATTKKENGKTIEMVTKREIYSPLLLANTSPLPPEYMLNPRRLRQVTPLLSCLRALWDFQSQAARVPGHTKEDLAHFTRLATMKHEEMQLPRETLRAEFLRSFMQNVGSELPPVTAFLGGQLAQDVINVLSKREQPIQNMLLFDGEESTAPIYALHPSSFEMPVAEAMSMGDGMSVADGMPVA